MFLKKDLYILEKREDILLILQIEDNKKGDVFNCSRYFLDPISTITSRTDHRNKYTCNFLNFFSILQSRDLGPLFFIPKYGHEYVQI